MLFRSSTLLELIKYTSVFRGNSLKHESNNTAAASATIIVPIYNGLNHLKKLLPTLIKNTNSDAKIILINDCSSEKKINEFLASFASIRNVLVVQNEENIGFVGTINKAMSLVTTRYAVWLNSDTVVPEYWLERLLAPFNEYEKIATATPFTNSGVTFSFPNFGEDNSLKYSLEETDRAFQKITSLSDGIDETYSGTGFCMAINMACWSEIGSLDQKAFGKGYGEENDWCLRGYRKGWKHVIVPNLFVQHCHGGSFQSEEKKKLINEHLDILKNRYPLEMQEKIPNFFKADPWGKYRELASIFLSDVNPIIVIDLKENFGDKSGAIDYRHKLIEEIEKSGSRVILVQYERFQRNRWSVVPVSISDKITIPLSGFSDIKLLFTLIHIKKVIINNFAFLETVEEAINIIHRLKGEFNFNLEYKFHDYLSICPSFFLINHNNKNCQGKSGEYCSMCLVKNSNRAIQRDNIFQWRSCFMKLFSVVDEFHFFSNYTLNIVKKIYPVVADKYTIKEHSPLFSDSYSLYKQPGIHEKLTLCFVGNFCESKGAHEFIELHKIFENEHIDARFVIVGLDNFDPHEGISFICGYNRDDLGRILTENKVHAVIYPSNNNETFSYVAQELMILNVPFVVFENGAPAERIRKYSYDRGEIAQEASVNGLYEATRNLIKKVYDIDI